MSKPIRSLLKFSFVFWIFNSTLFYAQTFAKKQTIFTGPEPYGIKAADLNNDKNQDLLWISSGHNVEIRLGHGDGTFSLTGPIYDTKLPSNAEFEVGDLDGDGKPDIAVAGGHSLAVLQGNGDGSFREPVLFNFVSSDPSEAIDSLALGDFNKDGKLDAVVSLGSTIQLAFGNSNARFQSPAKVFVVGANTTNAEAGDLDGDGNLDIALVTCCTLDPDAHPRQLRAWFGDGLGNFTVKTTIAEGVAQVKIKLFDLNRDGKSDIASTWKGCISTCVYAVLTWLGHNTRTFTFYSARVPDGPELRTGVASGDFDHDGILDLVTGTGVLLPDGFLIFRRLPNNTIAGPVLRSVQTNEPLIDTEIDSADFNHDGRPDLALTYAPDNRVVVMVNTTTPQGTCSDGPLYSLHLCSPGSGQTFVSGVHVSARANSDRTITSWKVYVDGVAKAIGTGANIEASITLGSFNFQRRITAKAWDASGANFSTSVLITVK